MGRSKREGRGREEKERWRGREEGEERGGRRGGRGGERKREGERYRGLEVTYQFSEPSINYEVT